MLEFSLLCLKRWNKEQELDKILPHVDSLHLDIMDGDFVPPTAFTVKEINNFKVNIPKHVHIMAYHPETYIEKIKDVNSISFHYESTDQPLNIIKKIKNKGFRVGITINPETDIKEIKHLINHLDRIIIMAVRPGYGGQKYLQNTSKKISDLREFDKDIEITIDGGMNEDTIKEVMALSADSYVICSVLVKSGDYAMKAKELRKAQNIGIDLRHEVGKDLFEPFDLDLDFITGEIKNCNRVPIKLSSIKHLYSKTETNKILKISNPTIYSIYEHKVPKRKGHFVALTTIINPGKIGNDYYMTEGFEHKDVSSAEILLCLNGVGTVLMQAEFGNSIAIKISKGKICYIPPYWSYRVVNTSKKDNLSFFCTFSAYSIYYSRKLNKSNIKM